MILKPYLLSKYLLHHQNIHVALFVVLQEREEGDELEDEEPQEHDNRGPPRGRGGRRPYRSNYGYGYGFRGYYRGRGGYRGGGPPRFVILEVISDIQIG